MLALSVHRRVLLRSLSCAVVAWCAQPARAADDDEPVLQAEAPPVIVEAEGIDATPVPGETRVELKGRSARMLDVLDAVPGVRVMRAGGQGGAAQLSIRGLHGRRVATYLGPVRLDDPATGILDLSELPAAALSHATLAKGTSSSTEGALGGVLQLRPAYPVQPVLSAGVQLGSWRSLQADVSAGAPTTWRKASLGMTAHARMSTTSGSFAYTPVAGPVDAPVLLPERVRLNNDRHRFGVTLLAAGEWAGGPSATGVLDVVTLEGGVPGYGLAPLTASRESQTRVLAGTDVDVPLGTEVVLRGQWSGRASAWRFQDVRAARQVAGALLTRSLSQRLELVVAPVAGLQVSAGSSAQLDVADSRGDAGWYDAWRPMSGVHGDVRAHAWDGRLRTRAVVVAQVYTSTTGDTWKQPRVPDLVLLPELSAELEPLPNLVMHGAVGRAWRIPSLEELHRPADAPLAGNADLRPEDGVEVQGGMRLLMGPLMGSFTAYGARMSNLIAYVNVNAFDVRPYNVADVWRAGGDVNLVLQLGDWGALDGGADVNLSHVTATNAPLPAVPPFEMHLGALLGPPAARLFTDVVGRAPSRGNLHGELPIRGAMRLDVGAVVHPVPWLEVRATVRNVTDDKALTDWWGVPQPGREFGLSVRWDGAQVE
ncbi:MAG: TonB-dependent receptor [Myxococcota bacterium]